MATTTSVHVLYFILYTVLPASASLGIPVMTIAVKRYTSPKTRSMAFGLFYTVMNVAALINGIALDALRRWLCHGITILGVSLSDGNRVVVASGAVAAAVALVVSLFLSPAVEEEALAHAAGAYGDGLHFDGETEGLVAERAHGGPPAAHARASECVRAVCIIQIYLVICRGSCMHIVLACHRAGRAHLPKGRAVGVQRPDVGLLGLAFMGELTVI